LRYDDVFHYLSSDAFVQKVERLVIDTVDESHLRNADEMDEQAQTFVNAGSDLAAALRVEYAYKRCCSLQVSVGIGEMAS
jgi:hypothetical protein